MDNTTRLIHELKDGISVAVYDYERREFVIRVSEYNFLRVKKMVDLYFSRAKSSGKS
jgi:hypothetical protein